MTGVNIPLLDVKKLAYLLVDGYWQVSVIDEIDSTQTYLTSKKPFHGEVIAAEFQSAGRGRLDRKFEAGKSQSLLFSFYIEPKNSRQSWGWIPLIAGACVARILNGRKNIFVTKWPNDILVVNGKHSGKVAGILSEATHEGVVVGIGINISMREEDLPVTTATSLYLQEIDELDRNVLLAEFLKEFSEIYSLWEDGLDIRKIYSELCFTLGKEVTVIRGPAEEESGIAREMGANGELVLEGDRPIYSGDVIHLYT